MARGKPKKRQLEEEPQGLSHNPFGALRGSVTPADSEPEAPSERAPESPGDEEAPVERLVVRKERTGRGGKTVTRVSGGRSGVHDLERWARELKRALGCGATVEGDDVCVQGDQVERVAQLLESGKLAGWRPSKVTRGN